MMLATRRSPLRRARTPAQPSSEAPPASAFADPDADPDVELDVEPFDGSNRLAAHGMNDPSFSTLTDAKSAAGTRSSDELPDDDDSAASLALSTVARMRHEIDVPASHTDATEMYPRAKSFSPVEPHSSTRAPSARRIAPLWQNTAAAQKHRSLGTMPRVDVAAIEVASQRRAGGLRHRSLMRRERSRDGYGRTTPSFLEGFAERMRSVSPTPQSFSSDPSKIIAAMPDTMRPDSARGVDATQRAEAPSRTDLRAAVGAQKSFSLGTLSRRAPSISPSVSRSSGLGTDLPTPRSHQLSSTSLRRVLSLGRGRLDSDAHSVVSEPLVYAESAHIADDIWIAPKDLPNVERRVAAHNERRAQARAFARRAELLNSPRSGSLGASMSSTARHVQRINRERQISAVVPERMPSSLNRKRFYVEADPDAPVAMEIDARATAADDAGTLAEDALVNRPDPSEFQNADMSSRLIRLFFNSPSQNPVPPSTAKRAEDRRNSRTGSSRMLLFRKPSGRSRTSIHFADSNTSYRSTAAYGMQAGGPSYAGTDAMPQEYAYKNRARGIVRFANVRRWLRSRAYRKHQRRPERRPREAAV